MNTKKKEEAPSYVHLCIYAGVFGILIGLINTYIFLTTRDYYNACICLCISYSLEKTIGKVKESYGLVEKET